FRLILVDFHGLSFGRIYLIFYIEVCGSRTIPKFRKRLRQPPLAVSLGDTTFPRPSSEFPMRSVWHGLVVCGLFCAASAWLQAGDSAETKTLLEKAIKAAGGEAKVGLLKNLTWKGKFSIEENGQQIAVNLDGSLQGWDRQRLELEVN